MPPPRCRCAALLQLLWHHEQAQLNDVEVDRWTVRARRAHRISTFQIGMASGLSNEPHVITASKIINVDIHWRWRSEKRRLWSKSFTCRLTQVWQFSSWTRSTTTASSSTRCRARRHAALRVEVYVGSMSMTFSRRARRLWRRRIFPKQDRHVLLQHQHITTKLQCHLNCLGTKGDFKTKPFIDWK